MVMEILFSQFTLSLIWDSFCSAYWEVSCAIQSSRLGRILLESIRGLISSHLRTDFVASGGNLGGEMCENGVRRCFLGVSSGVFVASWRLLDAKKYFWFDFEHSWKMKRKPRSGKSVDFVPYICHKLPLHGKLFRSTNLQKLTFCTRHSEINVQKVRPLSQSWSKSCKNRWFFEGHCKNPR